MQSRSLYSILKLDHYSDASSLDPNQILRGYYRCPLAQISQVIPPAAAAAAIIQVENPTPIPAAAPIERQKKRLLDQEDEKTQTVDLDQPIYPIPTPKNHKVEKLLQYYADEFEKIRVQIVTFSSEEESVKFFEKALRELLAISFNHIRKNSSTVRNKRQKLLLRANFALANASFKKADHSEDPASVKKHLIDALTYANSAKNLTKDPDAFHFVVSQLITKINLRIEEISQKGG